MPGATRAQTGDRQWLVRPRDSQCMQAPARQHIAPGQAAFALADPGPGHALMLCDCRPGTGRVRVCGEPVCAG